MPCVNSSARTWMPTERSPSTSRGGSRSKLSGERPTRTISAPSLVPGSNPRHPFDLRSLRSQRSRSAGMRCVITWKRASIMPFSFFRVESRLSNWM